MPDWLIELISLPNMILLAVIAILIVGKFGFKLNYISNLDIIKNHLNCFRSSKDNKLLVLPVITYFALPFFVGLATALKKVIDSDTINIITIIVSILTAMLFAMLTMIIEMQGKIKNNPEYYSTEAIISKQILLETYYTVMFEILVSVCLLALCLLFCFTKAFGGIQSFLIYSLTYLFILNLLMVMKRIFRLIDIDMKK